MLGIQIRERERTTEKPLSLRRDPAGGEPGHRVAPSDLFLGDLRLGAGNPVPLPRLQTVFSLTLPTSTGPQGYGREVSSANRLNTLQPAAHVEDSARGQVWVRVTRPPHGDLPELQRELFALAQAPG